MLRCLVRGDVGDVFDSGNVLRCLARGDVFDSGNVLVVLYGLMHLTQGMC